MKSTDPFTTCNACGRMEAALHALDAVLREVKVVIDGLPMPAAERARLTLHALSELHLATLHMLVEKGRRDDADLAAQLPGLCGWEPCPAVDALLKRYGR